MFWIDRGTEAVSIDGQFVPDTNNAENGRIPPMTSVGERRGMRNYKMIEASLAQSGFTVRSEHRDGLVARNSDGRGPCVILNGDP